MAKELKKALYLDDKRVPVKAIPGHEDWVVVKNFDEFKDYILENGVPDYISFEHDLHEEHVQDYVNYQGQGIMAINYGDFTVETGLDCLKWLCEHIQEDHEKGEGKLKLNLVGIHSFNNLGVENLRHMANSFKEHMGWAADAFIAKPEFNIPGKDRPPDLVEIEKPKIIL